MKRIGPLFFITPLLFGCVSHINDVHTHPVFIPDDLQQVSHLLDSILEEDQKYRLGLQDLMDEFGPESEVVSDYWNVINRVDSGNVIVVTGILEKHGWLGASEIGEDANRALFLVIQHADHKTQEKYLPVMQQAVKDGNAFSSDLALLEDRINLRNGKLQMYGSQIGRDPETKEFYVLPLFEPENVNVRRAQVDLPPIEIYLTIWDLEWDVEAYKQKLPCYKNLLKKELGKGN